MPPWLPEVGEYKFEGEMRLSNEQIALFRSGQSKVRPEGDPRDLPAAPKFTSNWQLGKSGLDPSGQETVRTRCQRQ